MQCVSCESVATTVVSEGVINGWLAFSGTMAAVRASSVGECATTQTVQRCASSLLPWTCRASAVAANTISSRQSTAVHRIVVADNAVRGAVRVRGNSSTVFG